MAVFRWIVRVLAALGIGTVWWFTVAGLNAATDATGIAQSLSKGLVGSRPDLSRGFLHARTPNSHLAQREAGLARLP